MHQLDIRIYKIIVEVLNIKVDTARPYVEKFKKKIIIHTRARAG